MLIIIILMKQWMIEIECFFACWSIDVSPGYVIIKCVQNYLKVVLVIIWIFEMHLVTNSWSWFSVFLFVLLCSESVVKCFVLWWKVCLAEKRNIYFKKAPVLRSVRQETNSSTSCKHTFLQHFSSPCTRIIKRIQWSYLRISEKRLSK